jgi:hypothetical protein
MASIVACLLVAATAPTPARADEVARGRILSVAIVGLPDDLYSCQPLGMSIILELDDDGSTRRRPVSVTTWMETPFGRAVLDEHVRMLRPGQRMVFSVAFAYRCVPPEGAGATRDVTIGVTASVKGESVEASHTMRLHDSAPPE